MTRKKDDTTIVLELTPREAAVIYEVFYTSDNQRGDFGKECREIKEALNDVFNSFAHITAVMCDNMGAVDGESFWFVDENTPLSGDGSGDRK